MKSDKYFNSIDTTPFTGKEYSLRYDESEPGFAKWLRQYHYNTQLDSRSIAELKKQFKNE